MQIRMYTTQELELKQAISRVESLEARVSSLVKILPPPTKTQDSMSAWLDYLNGRVTWMEHRLNRFCYKKRMSWWGAFRVWLGLKVPTLPDILAEDPPDKDSVVWNMLMSDEELELDRLLNRIKRIETALARYLGE